MEEKEQLPQQEEYPAEEAESAEALHRRRLGLTVRLCAALLLLALAFVLKDAGGETARAVISGGLTEKVSITECFAEIGKTVAGWFDRAGEGEI